MRNARLLLPPLLLLSAAAACRSSTSSSPGAPRPAGDPNGAPAAPPDGGTASASTPQTSGAAPVLEHHNGPARDGVYVVPGLTRAAAAGMHLDATFDGTYAGDVNAQPLYVPDGPNGNGAFYVATAGNDVIAIDERSGTTVWKKNLGPPATHEGEGCSGAMLGIMGTPVIDHAARTLYVDSDLSDDDGQGGRVLVSHLVHALSIDDGSERAGWPVDARAIATPDGFSPTVADQRGALALVNGTLFVPYGSEGDCGDYRGTLLAVDVTNPGHLTAWWSPALHSGVWAPSGVSSDGTNVFFATGNGDPLEGGAWGGSEAAYRFRAGPLSATPDDVYVADDWEDLDEVDGDLGGSGVVVVKDARSTPSTLAVVCGKDGDVYLIDALHMASGAPVILQAASSNIVDAVAAVPNDQGTMLVLDAQSGGTGAGCPAGEAGDLVGVQIVSGSPPSAHVAWCRTLSGHGSPIVTTTDGTSEAIVWITMSDQPYEGNGRLGGFDAATGEVIYDSLDPEMTGLARFNTLIAANGRLAVGADDRMYVYAFP